MLRRFILGVPLLSFWLAGLLALGTLLASRVEGAAFVPASWAALALQVTGLTQLTGAGSATDDDLIIYDTSASAIKRISRSELASVVSVSIANYGYAVKSSDQAISATTATKITFTESIDVGANYASSTFTAPRTRYVLFGASMYVGCAVNQIIQYRVYVNGAEVTAERTQDQFNNGTPETLASKEWMLSLTAGDTLDIYAYAGSGATIYGAKGTSMWWVEIP